MPRPEFELTFDGANLEGLEDRTIRNLEKVVRKTAFNVKDGTQRRIREHDLIDTGAMLNNIAVLDVTEDGGFSKEVVLGQQYAAVHEFGRLDGSIPAKPFLRPSVSDEREPFLEAVTQVLSGRGPE